MEILIRRKRKMAIKKEQCKRKELRDVKICVRVTKSMSKFMHDNEISPSVLMIEALKEMGYKG
jgi:hypothetical protein